jgi:hypothetical protein
MESQRQSVSLAIHSRTTLFVAIMLLVAALAGIIFLLLDCSPLQEFYPTQHFAKPRNTATITADTCGRKDSNS